MTPRFVNRRGDASAGWPGEVPARCQWSAQGVARQDHRIIAVAAMNHALRPTGRLIPKAQSAYNEVDRQTGELSIPQPWVVGKRSHP